MFFPKKQLLSLLLISQSFSLFAASADNPPISIPKVTGEIAVDAKLDEPQWQQATKVLVNNITRPYDNIPSPVNTEVLLMESEGVLYIAFIAEDPDPSQIRAFLRDRDRAWEDDVVGIKIDSFNDQRSAYRFLVNPLGAQIDGIESEITKKESDSWDGIWNSAGEINDKGFIVEMSLPLRMLNFNEKTDMQTWGIELIRMYPRSERLRLSNITLDRANDCEICQLVPAEGFKGLKQSSNLIVAPSLVLGASESREDDADWERTTNVEPSLDIRWGITPDVLLNATINPDFSTVETDSAQLNINNTFALRFEEKRPFFLDNADYFDSNYNLVYTRNINAPNFGAKLTARKSEHSLGLFLTDDSSTHILVPGNRSSNIAEIDGESKAGALRYRYAYGDNITVGWISTLRTAEDYSNAVHGIDARFRLSTYDVFKFQTLYSETEYPDDLYQQFCDVDDSSTCVPPDENTSCERGDCEYNETVLRTVKDGKFKGSAYRLGYYHTDSEWHYKLTYDKQDSDFRADLGFVPQVDFNRWVAGGHRKWYAEPNQWWTQFKIYSDYDVTKNDSGELIEKEFDLSFHLDAQYNSYLEFWLTDRDRVGSRKDKSNIAIKNNTTMFNEKLIGVYGQIKPIIGLKLSSNFSYGDQIDFSNDRLGKATRMNPRINWNVNEHLELRLNHTYRKLDADGDNVFVANLTDFRTTYQFDIQSFLRLTLIYSDIERNAFNYPLTPPEDVTPESKSLGAELLYAYKINPQTVFYLGYSDYHETEQAFTDLRQNERSVFMKMSYAWIR